jgi:antirestriction protein
MEIRIYVADLAAHNDGRLIGEWLTLPVDSDTLENVMNRMTHDGQHDYAIHDYEAPFSIAESDDPWELNEIAEQLDSVDIDSGVLELILDYAGTVDEGLEIITSGDYTVYENCHSMEDVAYEYVESTGMLLDVPNSLKQYFDYEAFGRDLDIEGTFLSGGGFYVEITR